VPGDVNYGDLKSITILESADRSLFDALNFSPKVENYKEIELHSPSELNCGSKI
jgi:hypothetical protein